MRSAVKSFMKYVKFRVCETFGFHRFRAFVDFRLPRLSDFRDFDDYHDFRDFHASRTSHTPRTSHMSVHPYLLGPPEGQKALVKQRFEARTPYGRLSSNEALHTYMAARLASHVLAATLALPYLPCLMAPSKARSPAGGIFRDTEPKKSGSLTCVLQ